MKMKMELIGDIIVQQRKKKGLTLTELAEKAEISKSNLSNIERNINKNPSVQVLNKIAEVLEVDLITLLGINIPSEELTNAGMINRLNELDLTVEELKEFEEVIEFIKWRKEQKENK
jgi:XRE family transcriptional regulator, master regulator for biofilm formation